jgi:hypothetical protein
MPKSKITALTVMFVLVFFATIGGNGAAGETYNLRTTKYADKWEELGVGYEEGHVIVVEEAKGIITNMEGKSFGDGWALKHVGLLDINPKTGVAFGHGYEEVTDKDGDKFFSRWEGEAIGENRWQGKYTVTGGTGKYVGITGGGIWSLTSVAPMQWYTDERWELELP